MEEYFYDGKKISIILLIIYDLIVLPFALYSLWPDGVADIMDKVTLFNHYVVYSAFVLLIPFTILNSYLWAAIIILLITACIVYFVHKKSLTAGYTVMTALLSIIAVYGTLNAQELVDSLMSI